MSKFSRREFLKISTLFFAGTGATLLVDRALAHDRPFTGELLRSDEDEIIGGKIVFIDASGFVNIQSQEKTIPVYFSDGASFARGKQGAVSGINDYELGEKVVADGVWEGEIFRAHTLMSIYQLVEGTVIDRTRDSLLTTGGTLHFVPETKAANGYISMEEPLRQLKEKPLSQIEVGDDFGALIWQEPEAKDYFALRIGVAEKHSHK
jgi:hypothetical protein